jgi:hypothetical protein
MSTAALSEDGPVWFESAVAVLLMSPSPPPLSSMSPCATL